jgi:hypothetical protein
VLKPRKRWDENRPQGAKARDWWPWLFDRRLSVTRRPLVQLSTAADPDILVAPTLIDANIRYLCEAASGRLPVELFDTPEMRSWIGSEVDRNGHGFNETVAERLRAIGWMAATELKLTTLGGAAELGDIDVLAWQPDRAVVYAIECKRLLFARTIGEVGERLTEYTTLAHDGGRTPIQKHVERIAYLTANIDVPEKHIRTKPGSIEVRSALVTDYLVPMQFSEKARSFVDLVTDLA